MKIKAFTETSIPNDYMGFVVSVDDGMPTIFYKKLPDVTQTEAERYFESIDVEEEYLSGYTDESIEGFSEYDYEDTFLVKLEWFENGKSSVVDTRKFDTNHLHELNYLQASKGKNMRPRNVRRKAMKKTAMTLKEMIEEGSNGSKVDDALEDYLKDFDIDGETGEILVDSGWEDQVTEIIDSMVDIYNGDLLDWLKNDQDAVPSIEDAVKEGLVDTSNFDFWKLLSGGQFLMYQTEMYELIGNMQKEGYLPN